jgi:hypothetical protein
MFVHPRRIKIQKVIMQMTSDALLIVKSRVIIQELHVQQVRVKAIPLDLNMCFGVRFHSALALLSPG